MIVGAAEGAVEADATCADVAMIGVPVFGATDAAAIGPGEDGGVAAGEADATGDAAAGADGGAPGVPFVVAGACPPGILYRVPVPP